MNLSDPIVTFDESPLDIDIYAMVLPSQIPASETADEPPIDPNELFANNNDEFTAKIESLAVVPDKDATPTNLVTDPELLRWKVVKTDSEVHVEILEHRLKLLKEGKIKPKAPTVNKDPFRDEEIIDLDSLVPQAYEPTSDQDPLLDHDEEQDTEWLEDHKPNNQVHIHVAKEVHNENTPILGRRPSEESPACCCSIC